MHLFKRFGIVPIVIIAAVVGAGAGTLFLTSSKATVEATGKPVAPLEEMMVRQGAMIKLDDRVVNLADPGGRRYLKIGITIEIEPENPEEFANLQGEAIVKKEKEIRKSLEPKFPQINDILTTLLSSKTYEQIATIEGKGKLKNELHEQLEMALVDKKIMHIYFTEFVVQ